MFNILIATMLYHFSYLSPIGKLLISCNKSALCKLIIIGNSVFSANLSSNDKLPIYLQTVNWLNCYFSGNQPNYLPDILLMGTEFQKKVWKSLLEIPFGETITYGEIANKINCNSAQAVGQAVSKNPIHIILPCHRVVAKNSLGGFVAGIDKKILLLNHESQISNKNL